MQTRLVTFSGSEDDEYGMPHPYYFYGVVALQEPGQTGYTVIVMPASSGTPVDIGGIEIVPADTEGQALRVALDKLKSHPSHASLAVQEGELPVTRL